jgi:nitrous oxidase accessory protein NosD
MREATGGDPHGTLEAAERGSTVQFDPAAIHRIERPVQVTTPGVTVEGLAVRLADGADATLVEIGADGVTLRDFRVDGNRANQPGDRQSSGVTVAGARGVTVERGTVRDVTRHGVRVVDPATVTSDTSFAERTVGLETTGGTAAVTVRDLRVRNPRRDGCSVEGPDVTDVRVENVHTVDSDDRGGVEIKDGAAGATVTGCHAADCRYGVAVQDHGGHGVADVLVTGNTAARCDKLVDGQNDVRHESVAVVGNAGRELTGADTWPEGQGGIYLNRVDGLLVVGNLLGPVDDTGIRVEECATARIAGNVVRGTNAGPGIAVAGGETIAVTDNVVRGAGPGIRADPSPDGVLVTDNLAPDGVDVGER